MGEPYNVDFNGQIAAKKIICIKQKIWPNMLSFFFTNLTVIGKKIVFTDKSKFILINSDGVQYV